MDKEDTREATMVFVLGLLSIVLCQLCGPVAWMRGNNYVNTCHALGTPVNPMGQIGRVLGIVGTCLMVLQIGLVCLGVCLVPADDF